MKIPKFAKKNILMVLFMCKEHVTILRINIWPSQVYLGIIQNFSKNRKKVKKKVIRFFQKKNRLCNSYTKVTKMLKFSNNSNFLSIHIDKTTSFWTFFVQFFCKIYFDLLARLGSDWGTFCFAHWWTSFILNYFIYFLDDFWKIFL